MIITARMAVTAAFVSFGVALGLQTGAMPFLIEQSGVDRATFGLAGSLGMASTLAAMGVGGWLSRHADARKVLLTAVALLYVFLWFALLVATPLAFLLSFVLLSLALGTMDLFMNAEAARVERQLRRPVFNSFHGSLMLAIAPMAIVSSLISAWEAPWAGAILAAIPIAFALFAISKAIPPKQIASAVNPSRHAPLPYRFLALIGLAIGFEVSCEVAAIQWAGNLLTATAPDLASISGLGTAFYALCNGSMRMVSDRLRLLFGDLRLMSVSLFIAIIGFVVLSLNPGFALSVAAFAAVGCGLAAIFPCLFSLSGRLVPHAAAAAMGFASAIGGAPRIVLPWVLGVLAQWYSLGAVFAACAGMCLVALTLITASFAKADAAAVRA